MKIVKNKSILLFLIFLGISLNIYAQKRQRRAKLDTYNFSLGLRVGEPTGVEGHFYLGGTMATKKRSAAFFKSWAVQVAYGPENKLPPSLPEEYKDRVFVTGGNRIELNFLKYFYGTNNYELQLYGGLGLQSGTRHFKFSASQSDTEIRWATGSNIILGLESEIGRTFLNSQRSNYLIFTLFAEGRGYVELAPQLGWYYIKYAGGIRFNFWR